MFRKVELDDDAAFRKDPDGRAVAPPTAGIARGPVMKLPERRSRREDPTSAVLRSYLAATGITSLNTLSERSL
ncbi:MAG: hypothetical protein EOP84_30035 [Verrucomicrobiaceae bacterium]|nr:MAG: hypothetical protein EOP84_30035 [Verrucomicrobiaceae bacterium]